jgi:hypothetical protein
LGSISREADFLLRTRLQLAILAALIASSCSLYRSYQASKPENIRVTESMLSDAGFQTIKIDTSEQIGLAEDLEPYDLRKYSASSGPVFWYYDPKICSCVYEGHQGEYDRYQVALRSQSDTAQYAAESEQEEVASLNAINGGFFPPPIFVLGGFGVGFGGGRGGGHPHGGGGGHPHGGGGGRH